MLVPSSPNHNPIGPKQGEWKFDPTYWKDPGESAMRRLLSTWKETSSLPPPSSDLAFAPSFTSSLNPRFESNLLGSPVSAFEKHPVVKLEESEI